MAKPSTTPPTSVTVDVKDHTRPQLIGFADSFWIGERGLSLEVVLFERNPEPLVVTHFLLHFDDLITSIWPIFNRFYAEISKPFERAGVLAVTAATERPPITTISYVANIVALYRHGLDGQIDLHYVTPRSIVSVAPGGSAQSKEVELIPLASVQVPIPLLLGMLAAIASRMPGVMAKMPTEHGVS